MAISLSKLVFIIASPWLDRGGLEPVLEPWWPRFPGPFLDDPGRRYLLAPLRAFVDFIAAAPAAPHGAARTVV